MARVGIVGAGAAGMLAALQAAEAGDDVVLFDGNGVPGRKVLATGNGRCNLSNDNVVPERYARADAGFLGRLFAALPPARLLAYLESLGILTYAMSDGWRYPVSNSAAAVVDLLAATLAAAAVELRLGRRVTALRPTRGGFTIAAGDEVSLYVDRAIVACGGAAYPALGSRGDLWPVLERLGHTVVPPRPALAPLLLDMRRLHRLQGLRLDLRLELWQGRRMLGESLGNAIFTQTGLNGPAAMNLSHLVSEREGADLSVTLDLLHGHLPALRQLLAAKRREPLPLRALLGAVLPPKAPPVFLALAGIGSEAAMRDLGDAEVERVLAALTGTRLAVRGTGGLDVAQLSSGGVPVTEVEPETLASRVVPGLHIVGEALDVIGPCGGYNLHFAFTTGYLAGRAR